MSSTSQERQNVENGWSNKKKTRKKIVTRTTKGQKQEKQEYVAADRLTPSCTAVMSDRVSHPRSSLLQAPSSSRLSPKASPLFQSAFAPW